MEKKNIKLMRWVLSLTFFAVASFIISSCKNDDDAFSSENVQTSSNESVQESNTDEIDNLAEISLESQESASGGRAKGVSDDRLKCDGTTVVFSNVSTDKTSGTVTITFGPNGCTDKKGNVRKGAIIVSWTGGKWFNNGSTRNISLSNYSVNDITISGSRTLICTGVSGTLSDFTVTWNVMADHTFVWPDSKTGTRKVNKTKTWEHSLTEDKYIVSNGPINLGLNAAEGTNRYGKSYTTSISTPLVYLASCIKSNKVFLPVSGVKILINVAKEKTFTMDYGNGTCDNTFTVSSDGISKTLTAKNDSSQ